ncbi:16S rRNA (cytidine(1402)-2'-O)-methyltransferase [Patescibacteria group bacterium]
MAGKLYIVATPIGNLEDITLRALRILKEVDIVIAEDTRVTKKLLMHYDIDNLIMSYHQRSSGKKRFELLTQLIKGKNIALVTDAGTPGISDPGNELIDYLLDKEPNIIVIPIPGASAITSSLSVCGFKTNKFVFIGFLPKKKRTKLFGWLMEGKITFAFFESPKRILKTLDVLKEHIGSENRVFIARELTKIHETLYRGTIDEVRESMKKDTIKGEIVVIVEI